MTQSTQILNNLVRRWWLVLVGILLGAGAGAGYAALADPTYTAPAHVVVAPSGHSASPDSPASVNFAQAYGRMAGQGQVLGKAAAARHRTREEMRRHVRATTSPDAPIVQVTGSAGTASAASADANATARALIDFGNRHRDDTRVKLALLSKATAPTTPTAPKRDLDIAVGAAGGLLVGALAGMLRPAASRARHDTGRAAHSHPGGAETPPNAQGADSHQVSAEELAAPRAGRPAPPAAADDAGASAGPSWGAFPDKPTSTSSRRR